MPSTENPTCTDSWPATSCSDCEYTFVSSLAICTRCTSGGMPIETARVAATLDPPAEFCGAAGMGMGERRVVALDLVVATWSSSLQRRFTRQLAAAAGVKEAQVQVEVDPPSPRSLPPLVRLSEHGLSGPRRILATVMTTSIAELANVMLRLEPHTRSVEAATAAFGVRVIQISLPMPSSAGADADAGSVSADAARPGDLEPVGGGEGEDDKDDNLALVLGLSLGIGIPLVCCLLLLCLWYVRRRPSESRNTEAGRASGVTTP